MKNLQNQTTILLIENDSAWLASVYLVLREAGYDVLIAAGGDKGFCLARRVRPDLIVCEAALPDICGVQLCYMIRADKNLRDARFILMGEVSGLNGDTAFEGFRAGADDCFEEKCNPQFLRAKIERLLALRRLDAELRQRCQNLRRSELRLRKTIKETSDSVAAFDPAFRFAAFDERAVQEHKNFFGKSDEPKNQKPKKSGDALATWKHALQPKEILEASKIRDENGETVCYEIVC